MKTEVTLTLLDIVMQTRYARPHTNAPLQDIVYLLEATLYPRRVRNKIWWLGLVLKLSIEIWLWQLVNSYDSNSFFKS